MKGDTAMTNTVRKTTRKTTAAKVAKVKAVNTAVEATVVAEAKAEFNMSAALNAAANAPVGHIRTTSSENRRLDIVTQILTAAEGGLTMPQIKAAYFAGLQIENPSEKELKQVYETVFQHADCCNNKNRDKAKAIFTRDADGKYSIKK